MSRLILTFSRDSTPPAQHGIKVPPFIYGWCRYILLSLPQGDPRIIRDRDNGTISSRRFGKKKRRNERERNSAERKIIATD